LFVEAESASNLRGLLIRVSLILDTLIACGLSPAPRADRSPAQLQHRGLFHCRLSSGVKVVVWYLFDTILLQFFAHLRRLRSN